MRCRWLLCLEEYEKRRLNLLSMVPRKWLDDGQVIAVQGMKTYYGELSYKVESRIDAGRIYVEVDLAQGPGPAVETLAIRLPHPASKKAIYTTAGNYCAYNETVTLTQFAGKASFELVF